MRSTFLFISVALGLLALISTQSKGQDVGFKVPGGPIYYEGGRCVPWYEDPPAYDYDRSAYYPRPYYRRYHYRPAYVRPYYHGHDRRGHRCRHEEYED